LLIKFLVPSLLGVLLFLVPFSVGGTINIGMGFAADGLKALLGDALPAIATVVLCLSVALTLVVLAHCLSCHPCELLPEFNQFAAGADH
jgi:nucleoside recognition membrane protein YjiH